MAIQRPLSIINGKTSVLPTGDTIDPQFISGSSSASYSLFADTTNQGAFQTLSNWALGIELKARVAGTVTQLRLFREASMIASSHTLMLWKPDGSLSESIVVAAGGSGIATVTLLTPLALNANDQFIISMDASNGYTQGGVLALDGITSLGLSPVRGVADFASGVIRPTGNNTSWFGLDCTFITNNNLTALNAQLQGLVITDSTTIKSTDTTLAAIGKLQAQSSLKTSITRSKQLESRRELFLPFAPIGNTSWFGTYNTLNSTLSTITASSGTNASVRLYKFIAERTGVIDALALECALILATTGKFRVALYRSNAAGTDATGSAILATGELDGTVVGMKGSPATITGGVAFQAGTTMSVTEGETLWIGLWTAVNSTMQVRACLPLMGNAFLASANTFPTANLAGAFQYARQFTSAYSAAGAFPDVTAGSVLVNLSASSSAYPNLYLRYSS